MTEIGHYVMGNQLMKYLFYLLSFLPCSLFAQSTERSFSRQQIKEDMQFFIRTVENVHPNPYHFISKEKYAALNDSLHAAMKDSISLREAWACFSLLTAAFNEGHSTIGYPAELQQQIQQGAVPLFPVLVREFNGEELVVRFDLSADSVLHTGDLISSINGVTAKDLLTRFSAFYGGLPAWRNLQVLRDFAGQLVLHNIQPPYRVSYIHEGQKKDTVLQPVSITELQNKIAWLRRRTTSTVVPAPYSFQRTSENTGYLNFRSMRDLPLFEQFLDSVFSSIKENPVEGLIIDLRQNGGGSSVLGEKLIGYISDKPFRMGGGSTWKVSDEYKAFIREQAKTNAVYASGSFRQYLNKNTGEFISYKEGKTQHPGKNKLRYTGKVCVLTGPSTFSSANMLSNAIKDYGLATIIGEATGEPCNDYGELYWNKLPHTALTFYTCSKKFIRANGNAEDPDPVLPDIEVKQDPKSGKDDVLEFAKEWIRKK